MSESWFQDYVCLQFRMDRVIQKFTKSRFVDYYYGPQEWKAIVEAEPETSAPDLVRGAMVLADALPAQGFEAHRLKYLQKQVVALETICRKLNGETFALQDEVERCFDIRPTWIAETNFEQAQALYDEILPGNGSLFERLQAFRTHYELAPEKSGLLMDLMQETLAEARRRTRTFLDLPQGEEVELRLVSDQVFGGENWYLGNYRSRVEVNTDFPANMRYLLDLVCHEGYPGHHTEFVLKERSLYQERGYMEQAISPIICPQSVISEGIATSAFDMIFTPEEAEQWAVEHLYPAAGIEPIPIDIGQLARAQKLMAGVQGNARFMLSDGYSDKEVNQYLVKYGIMPEERAWKALDFLKDPFREAYIFTYFYGRQLMQPWLQGPNRREVFKSFLTEQICPSDLQDGWAAYQAVEPHYQEANHKFAGQRGEQNGGTINT